MNWNDFLPHVLPSVKGCPEQIAVDHVIKAAREFCARTSVWNYACDPIYSQRGATNYTLQLGPDQELVRVYLVTVGDDRYAVPRGAYGRRIARRHTDRMATFTGPVDFQLNPPSRDDGERIVVDVAVKPALTATLWPDDLAEYVPDIANGAIASLSVIPKQDWHDLNSAQVYGSLFRDRISAASFKVQGGYSHTYARSATRLI